MKIEELLKPYNEAHSIKEVVFTLYFSQLVEDFTPWEKLQDQMFNRGFNKFEKLSQKKYTLNSEDLKMKSEDAGRIGVLWKKQDETSTIKQLLQLRNIEPQNQALLFFHELSYVRWINFKEEYLNIIKEISLSESIGKNYVYAVNLTYIDEFTWIDTNPIQLNRIFKKDSPYLSKYFFDSKFPSIEIAAMKNDADSQKLLTERLAIDIQPTLPDSTILISHTIASSLSDKTTLFDFNKADLDSYLEKTHEYNKRALRELLCEDVQDLVKLPKNN